MAYIDTKYLGECDTCRHHSNSGCNTCCDHGEEYSPNLSKIPTADVVEVKHGEWIDKPCIKKFNNTNVPVVECAKCGISFCDIINNHRYIYRYCPYCGAKMGGERRDT